MCALHLTLCQCDNHTGYAALAYGAGAGTGLGLGAGGLGAGGASKKGSTVVAQPIYAVSVDKSEKEGR